MQNNLAFHVLSGLLLIPAVSSSYGGILTTTDVNEILVPERVSHKAVGTFEENLRQLVEQNKLPGVAAGIVRNQKLIWTKGIGYADIENKVPAGPTTLYRLASTSKPFAAVLIMQLVEQGKLTPDTPMADFRVPPRYEKKPIAVKHVLSHTSEWAPGARFDYSGDAYLEGFAIGVGPCGQPNVLKLRP